MDNNIPREYRPLGAWAYVGYNFLFAIPFIGFILLIVFALSKDNINRRNYARSYFCTWLLAFIIIGIIATILIVTGASPEIINSITESA